MSLLRSQVKIEEMSPEIRMIRGATTAKSCFVGVAERGPIGTPTDILDLEQFNAVFGGHRANATLRSAVEAHFQEGGGACVVSRTCHYSDLSVPTSYAATLSTHDFSTDTVAAASKGSVTGTLTGPFDCEPGDTLQVDYDAGSEMPLTLAATAAELESTAGPFDLFVGGIYLTLTLTVDGVAQTHIFLVADFLSGDAATAAEVAAVINRDFHGVQAYVDAGDGSKLKIRTDHRGSAATLQASGTAAAAGALALAAQGEQAGTGDVEDIDAVTITEIVGLLAGLANVTASSSSGRLKLERNVAGATKTVTVNSSSTLDGVLGLDNDPHAGAAASPAVPTLRLSAKYFGGWGDDLDVSVVAASNGEAARFDLKIYENDLLMETWPNLSMLDTDSRYVETIINHATTGSLLVIATDLDAAPAAPADRPVNIVATALSGGGDGIAALADTDFVGSETGGTGLFALDVVPDGTLLLVPERSSLQAVSTGMLNYCEVKRAGRMVAIFDPPAGLSASGVKADQIARGLGGVSEFGAYFWPRLVVANPDKSVFGPAETIVVAPCGHVSGLIGRTDSARVGGIYDNPAGEEKGKLTTVLGLETDEVLKDAARDLVYPERINPFHRTPGGVFYLDGCRTLKGDGNFPSIAERLGATFIEASIRAGISWARHQNNDDKLRRTLYRSAYAFLLGQYKVGAFRGDSPQTSFSVNFGDDLNPPTEVFAERINGEIGIATQKPGEFIVLRFRQDTRDIQAELAKAGA